MSKFKIALCDDNKTDIVLMKTMILALKEKYDIVEEPTVITFQHIIQDNLLPTIKPDVLILDLYDEESKEWLGKDCLVILKEQNANIPTIIYSGDKTGAESDINFKITYPFILEDLNKNKYKTDGLKLLLEAQILKKLPNQFILENENDLILLNQIEAIEENNLNQILKKIKEKLGIESDITIERMVSGFSGAFLFKFSFHNTSYIIKVAKEPSKLELEFTNSQDFYHKFPNKFFNYISPIKYYSFDEKTMAILIKLVEKGRTLFEFILDSKNRNRIEEALSNIFIGEFSLQEHYMTNKNEKKIWNTVFEKFSGIKFSIVTIVIKELSPLLNDSNFNSSNLQNLVINNKYNRLDKNSNFKKNHTTLCHGDLHSKNILLQDTMPFLIDTGGIKYDFWCSDICRLIVDLFINGFDQATREYYDIQKINENVNLGTLIIKMQDIQLDGKNDNVITALNWLSKNCETIYGDLFCLFEFQLGLMKEFLQMSYRIESVPPNKRAIALLLAYECMLNAEKNVEN